MGEAFGLYRMGDDEALMPLISVANVACGFHASDFNHMRKTVQLAKRHGVGVGAHPSLPDLQGKTVRLADFAGKPLVVNFFTAESCDWAGAALSKLYMDNSGKGLQVVGINLYDKEDALRSCIAKHGVKYPVLRGDQPVQNAWIGSSSGWATFFVTPDGKILKKITDSIDQGLEGPVFAKYAKGLLMK